MFERFPTSNLLDLMHNLGDQQGLAWGEWEDEDGNRCPAMHGGFLVSEGQNQVTCTDDDFLRSANGFSSEWDQTDDTQKTRDSACEALLDLLVSIHKERTAKERDARVVGRIFAPLPKSPQPVFAGYSANSTPAAEFASVLS